MRQSDVRQVIAAFLIITTLAFQVAIGQVRRARQPREQVSFGAESLVERPVPLPPDVLRQLTRFDNRRVEECQQSLSRRPSIRDHFAASEINLNNDSRRDLVVKAESTCFGGAHTRVFWVFLNVGQGRRSRYNLVFYTQTDFIKVLNTSRNGFRDIEAVRHTMRELYSTYWRHNGRGYRPRRCTHQVIEEERVTRIPCGSEPPLLIS